MSHRNVPHLRLDRIAASLLFVLSFVCIGSVAPAASPDADDIWKWTKDAEHLNSVVQVSMDGGIGTGVVVQVGPNSPRHDAVKSFVLTAYHIVESATDKSVVRITYHDGTEHNGRLVEFDGQHDIALIVTEAPKGLKPAVTSNVAVRHRMYLEFAGLGGGANLEASLRHFAGKATRPTDEGFIYADETLLPGDSGGPIFNRRKELVGIISGGWFWWNSGATTTDGLPVLATWPARASNLAPIRKLLATIDNNINSGLSEKLTETSR